MAASVARFIGRGALRPVHNIPEALSIVMNTCKKLFCYQAGAGADKSVFPGEGQECFLFQFIVIGFQEPGIACCHVICPCHQHNMQVPFSGPARIKYQEVGGVSLYGIFAVNRIMADLLHIGIRLIRHSFPSAAINIYTHKRENEYTGKYSDCRYQGKRAGLKGITRKSRGLSCHDLQFLPRSMLLFLSNASR